ncbi:protein Niban 1a [Spinachia spinachia]
MGNSASSLLDDTKCDYVKGRAEAELREFSPYYRKQFSLARFSKLEDDLEQHKEKITQLLKHREAPEEGEVLYEDHVLFFDDTRKWKERYVVARANYCLECHDGLETFVKGTPPRQKLLPTGGTVLTVEEKYMAMVDKCFPDDTSVKEDFAPALSGMPGQFPVYLRLPYRRDYYFCFREEAKKAAFLSILSDCIRHQNHDFLKKKTCEVQAFLKAIQLYRQDRGQYEPWDMLIGSDVRVMANLVMEQLLPSLEKDMLPRLKSKKAERKRVWFATVEAAYFVVQEHLLEGLSALKEQCQGSFRQQEVLIHSDMDQILHTRRQLEEKVRAKVSARAEKLFSDSVQPYLASVLEELMEPVTCGFLEGRQLSERAMDQVCQDVLRLADKEELRKALADMARPNLLSCYQKIASLQERLQDLQERFGLSNVSGVIYSTQIDLQQLTENAAYTFELLLHKAVQDNPNNPGPAIEKAKPRVLKQYDYDSSTVRKRISREALVYITLPFIKKTLSSCKTELQGLEESVYAEHSNFIHIENIYESILLQSLDKEVTKVVKEAASLKKYNMFTDSRDLLSQSSRSSLSSSPVSTPGTPAMGLAAHLKTSVEPQPPSALAGNGPSSILLKDGQPEKNLNLGDTPLIETPLAMVGQTDALKIVPVAEEAEPTPLVEEEVLHTVVEAGPATSTMSETQDVKGEASPEMSGGMAAEPQVQQTDAPKEEEVALSEMATLVESIKTDVEDAAAQREAPAPSRDLTNEPEDLLTETTVAQTAPTSVKETNCGNSEIKSEAPPSGETPQLPSGIHPSRDMKLLEAEPVKMASETAPSEVESAVEVQTGQNSEDEVSTASGVLEDAANKSMPPVRPDETRGDEPSPRAQTEAVMGDGGRDAEAVARAEPSAEAADTATCQASEEESPKAMPIGCIKEIRDLVVEVIEVEELVKRYPCGVPKEEELS